MTLWNVIGFLFVLLPTKTRAFFTAAPTSISVAHPSQKPSSATSSPAKDRPLFSIGQVDSPGQRPTLQGPGGSEETKLEQKSTGDEKNDEENEFNLNVGRALDMLAVDVPLMFTSPPRLDIFTSNVVLKDPVGELCHGRRLYGALHTSLRVMGAITAIKPRVGVTSLCFSKSKKVVELKWTLAASAPLIGNDAVKLSAVSLYRVNDRGLIFEHAIDNRIKRDLWEYSHSWMGMLAGDRPPGSA